MKEVVKNEANIAKCICSGCPTFDDCAKGKTERLYCSKEVGKSDCELKMNGCTCGVCPVHNENELQSGYYCMHG